MKCSIDDNHYGEDEFCLNENHVKMNLSYFEYCPIYAITILNVDCVGVYSRRWNLAINCQQQIYSLGPAHVWLIYKVRHQHRSHFVETICYVVSLHHGDVKSSHRSGESPSVPLIQYARTFQPDL